MSDKMKFVKNEAKDSEEDRTAYLYEAVKFFKRSCGVVADAVADMLDDRKKEEKDD